MRLRCCPRPANLGRSSGTSPRMTLEQAYSSPALACDSRARREADRIVNPPTLPWSGRSPGSASSPRGPRPWRPRCRSWAVRTRKPLTASSARIFCAWPVEFGALGLVGSEVQFLDDLVEGRVVVVEVIVLARIDIDVVRLGVRHDRQVVVLVGEDLAWPVGPFDRDDLGLDADVAQLRGDDLAAVAGVADRRQLAASS